MNKRVLGVFYFGVYGFLISHIFSFGVFSKNVQTLRDYLFITIPAILTGMILGWLFWKLFSFQKYSLDALGGFLITLCAWPVSGFLVGLSRLFSNAHPNLLEQFLSPLKMAFVTLVIGFSSFLSFPLACFYSLSGMTSGLLFIFILKNAPPR